MFALPLRVTAIDGIWRDRHILVWSQPKRNERLVMIAAAWSPRQTRMVEISAVCLLAIMMGLGVLYQFMGWKLDGIHLVIVGILIVNYVNLFRAQLRQVSDRIDELEKRLAAPGP
jgi:divalent metal cation (Fe/Co/Zn/Cd) transporter